MFGYKWRTFASRGHAQRMGCFDKLQNRLSGSSLQDRALAVKQRCCCILAFRIHLRSTECFTHSNDLPYHSDTGVGHGVSCWFLLAFEAIVSGIWGFQARISGEVGGISTWIWSHTINRMCRNLDSSKLGNKKSVRDRSADDSVSKYLGQLPFVSFKEVLVTVSSSAGLLLLFLYLLFFLFLHLFFFLHPLFFPLFFHLLFLLPRYFLIS